MPPPHMWLHSTHKMLSIANAANSKRHQQLDEILIIFTRTIQEISKVVCKKTVSETRTLITSLCCMKRSHYSKRMLRKQDCVKFHGRIAWQSFSENNFADFSDVVPVKKIKISSSRWWRFQLATSPIIYASQYIIQSWVSLFYNTYFFIYLLYMCIVYIPLVPAMMPLPHTWLHSAHKMLHIYICWVVRFPSRHTSTAIE